MGRGRSKPTGEFSLPCPVSLITVQAQPMRERRQVGSLLSHSEGHTPHVPLWEPLENPRVPVPILPTPSPGISCPLPEDQLTLPLRPELWVWSRGAGGLASFVGMGRAEIKVQGMYWGSREGDVDSGGRLQLGLASCLGIWSRDKGLWSQASPHPRKR